MNDSEHVFVVTNGEGDDYQIVAVCRSRERADAFVERFTDDPHLLKVEVWFLQ